MCFSYWARAASLRTLAGPLLGATLCACALDPDYHLPEAPLSASYKELKGWKIATPRDHVNRGEWWSVYHDPTLDSLPPINKSETASAICWASLPKDSSDPTRHADRA